MNKNNSLYLGRSALTNAIKIIAIIFVVHFLHTQINLLLKNDQLHNNYPKQVLPQAYLAKIFSLGFDRVLADSYWLLFIQYYGDRDACVIDHFSQAPAYLYLIKELDPHFTRPYWFASFIMASELGLKKEAEKFLDDGIKANPGSWTLPYIAGFNQYMYMKNDKKAAYYYNIASRIKNAPDWLARQAKIMAEEIPSQVKIIRTWQKLYDQSDDLLVKEKARQSLRELWSKIYWTAPTEPIKARAIDRLKAIDSELLAKDQINFATK